MRNILSFLTRSHFLGLMGQGIVLLLCLAYIQHVFLFNILPDRKVSSEYKQTTCFLINKQLATKGNFIKRYRADFLVSYNVDNVQYNRWISGNGLDRSFVKNEIGQKQLLSQFDIGGNYTCWYNSEDPYLIAITLRHNWTSVFPIIVPLLVLVIMSYYFLRKLK